MTVVILTKKTGLVWDTDRLSTAGQTNEITLKALTAQNVHLSLG